MGTRFPLITGVNIQARTRRAASSTVGRSPSASASRIHIRIRRSISSLSAAVASLLPLAYSVRIWASKLFVTVIAGVAPSGTTSPEPAL
ncbi:hypothetical protein VTJ04DRAFT_1064 [Mycothermus thermophilus]|uniref:uncharacterized protein n=1 Tax=Humicola insolens TaxID=85995 RepID=UPI003742A766